MSFKPVKLWSPCDPEIPPPGVQGQLKTHIHTKTCTQMLILALFILANSGNKPIVHQLMMDKQNVVCELDIHLKSIS